MMARWRGHSNQFCAYVVLTLRAHAVASVTGSLGFLGNREVGNTINFHGVDSLTWSQDKYSISSGQLFSGSSANGTSIKVVAGRHGSLQPAVDFCSGVSVLNMIASSTSAPHWVEAPKNLNFVVFGTMTFTIKGKQYECNDMRVGQGHYLLTNNWWIGSGNCVRSSFGELNCGSLSNCGLKFSSTGKSDELQVAVMNTGDTLYVNENSKVNVKGDYTESLYQTDSPVVNGTTLKKAWSNNGWPQKLDYGLYFFSSDDVPEKYVPGKKNSFFDPSRPTLIFFHGWQPTTIQHDYRLSFDYHLNDPQFCPRSTPCASNFWIMKGWNMGIFYWDQFADEPLPELAEAKIWSPQGYVGMRYMTSTGEYQTDGVPKGASVTDLFVNTFRSLADASQGKAPQELRFAGASLGAQLSVHSAATLWALAESGSISSAWLPSRVALLDPYFTERMPVINPQSYTAGTSTAALVEGEVASLRKSGVIFELHRTSRVSDLPAPLAHIDEGLKKHAVYVRRYPNYCKYPVYHATKVAAFSFGKEAVEQVSDIACEHSAAFNLYFLSMGSAPSPLCSAPPAVPGEMCTSPSASCTTNELGTLSAVKMQAHKEFVQVRGMDTIAIDDDCFELRPDPFATSEPESFEFQEYQRAHDLWAETMERPDSYARSQPKRFEFQEYKYQQEQDSQPHFWKDANAEGGERSTDAETRGRSAIAEQRGRFSLTPLPALLVSLGPRLALVNVVLVCLIFLTRKKSRTIVAPQSLLG